MKRWWNTTRRRAPLAVALCLMCAAGTAGAADDCTKFFQTPATVSQLSWHVDEYWSPPGVPGPADVACVYEGGSYEVRVEQPVTVSGLRIDAQDEGFASVKIIATTFTLDGPGYLAGSTKLKVNDGAVLDTSASGSLEVRSQLIIEGGTVAVDVDLYGRLNWWGPSSLTGSLTTHPGSVIEVEDPMMAAELTIAEGFINNGSLMFNDAVEQSLTVLSGTLVNSKVGMIGSYQTTGSAVEVPVLDAEIDNRGQLSVEGVDLKIAHVGSQHQNGSDGTIQVTGAELEIDLADPTEVPSNFTNYGTTTVASGGSIRVNGSAGVVEVPSNFTNYGTTTVASGGSIRVNGSAGVGEDAPMTVLNAGSWVIHDGGVIEIINAILETPSTGQLSGDGLLDVDQAVAVTFGGELSPGFSAGIFDIEGSTELQTEARIRIEIGGDLPGVDHDRLDLTGTLAAAGALDVSLLGPFQPSEGDRFDVLTFAQLGGWFDQVTLPPLPNLRLWNIDVGANEVGLEVLCGGTEIGVDVAPDRDPVSLGYELIYHVSVTNTSSVAASDLVVGAPMPPELSYRADLSSPECALIGSTVECLRPSLAPSSAWNLSIGVEAVVTGSVLVTASAEAWECDTIPANNQDTGAVLVVAAEPCDANYDLAVDDDDLEPSVGHIFGQDAPGNPDCRLGDGVTSDDLSAIIDAAHSAP